MNKLSPYAMGAAAAGVLLVIGLLTAVIVLAVRPKCASSPVTTTGGKTDDTAVRCMSQYGPGVSHSGCISACDIAFSSWWARDACYLTSCSNCLLP